MIWPLLEDEILWPVLVIFLHSSVIQNGKAQWGYLKYVFNNKIFVILTFYILFRPLKACLDSEIL